MTLNTDFSHLNGSESYNVIIIQYYMYNPNEIAHNQHMHTSASTSNLLNSMSNFTEAAHTTSQHR